ncbi:MAG: TasA family protein [Candidatus Nanopelagicales bacterium]
MSTSTTRRAVLGAGVAAVALVGMTGLASSALFTSQDTTAGNTFTAGTVVLGTGAGASVFTVPAMAPGDVAYGKVPVANDGSLELRYAMTSSSSNTDGKGLASSLTATVVPTAAGATCDAAAITGGTAIYSGSLASAAFGDTTAGAQAGDRTLAGGASEALCVKIAFPANAANGVQGATTSTTLTFDGEQTHGNA